MKMFVCMVAATLAAACSYAEDLTVAAGSPKVMTAADSSKIYDGVFVNDDLTLDGANIAISNISDITIGQYATKPVTVTITNGAGWITAQNKIIKFKNKGGTFVISAPERKA